MEDFTENSELSPAIVQRNILNAQSSTGPRTPEGKARACMNSLKHGIFSQEAIITRGESKEDPAEFYALMEGLCHDLAPVGDMEELLTQKLCINLWRQKRLLRYEIGEIREHGDAPAETWEQRQFQDRMDFPGYQGGLASWEWASDLEWKKDRAERLFHVLSSENPLSQKDQAENIIPFIAEQAKHLDLNIKRLLGVRGEGAWNFFEYDESDLPGLEKLIEAVCKKKAVSKAEFWTWIRGLAKSDFEKALKVYQTRLMLHERLKMRASLPEDTATDKIIKYEAHLSREFSRTLAQLQSLQSVRMGGQGKTLEAAWVRYGENSPEQAQTP